MTTNLPRFKGGPIYLNCGGMGPDDYLIKPVKGGRWIRVLFRWGRHFDFSIPRAEAAANADADKQAMEAVFPLLHIPTSDNARRWSQSQARLTIPTMNASEFLVRYGQ